MVKAVFAVPHKRIDSGFERKVLFLEMEAGFLVIKYVSQRGHIENVYRHHGVKIQRIGRPFPWGVGHTGSAQGNPVETVGLLEDRIYPFHIFIENGDHVLDPFFVGRFMVQVKFGPGKEGQPQALGIILVFHHGKAGFDVIGGSYGPVRFLALIKNIQRGMSLINAIGIYKKKRRKNGVCLLYHGTAGIGKEFPFNDTFFITVVPIILNPCPGFVVYVNKILIIKVDLGKIAFRHKYS
jgi:hypothetical protein